MTLSLTYRPAPDEQPRGIARSLALGRVLHFESLMRRRLGEVRAQRYVRLHNYYAGQNLPPDNVEQPLMINYFKAIVDKHTSYLWGQWKKRLVEVRFVPRGKDDMDADELEAATAYGRRIKSFWDRIYDENRMNVTLWQASKNASLYGDGVLEVQYSEVERRIVIEALLPEYFHCIWDISNMQHLEEVIIAYPIDRVLALEKYGVAGNEEFLGYQVINPNYLPGIGILWKRWTHASCQVWVDEMCVLNRPNPYIPQWRGNIFPGLIPFVHVPNMQAGAEYFGYGDAEGIMFLQDELNRRMADMGDIVNVHAHPIITLKNFSGDQNDLPVGPDAVWDLGREGEAKRLEGSGPGPDTTAYLGEVKKAMHETSAMPETAFGTKSGGQSHTSGIQMTLAMMPVVERAKEKRLRWHEAIKDLVKMSFYLLAVRDPALLEAQGLDYPRMLLYNIEPVFADVLPKDELQVVNEAVATYANSLRSLERSLEVLGEDDVQTEIERIKQDMAFKASVGQPTPPPEGGTAGKNAEVGNGGTPSIPGSIGASASKAGTLIKSPETDQADAINQ